MRKLEMEKLLNNDKIELDENITFTQTDCETWELSNRDMYELVTGCMKLFAKGIDIPIAFYEKMELHTQTLIENSLDMWLDQKQLEYIYENWRAFYDDPVAYRGTAIIDMVKLGLNTLKREV